MGDREREDNGTHAPAAIGRDGAIRLLNDQTRQIFADVVEAARIGPTSRRIRLSAMPAQPSSEEQVPYSCREGGERAFGVHRPQVGSTS
jgi:hypothetical protein